MFNRRWVGLSYLLFIPRGLMKIFIDGMFLVSLIVPVRVNAGIPSITPPGGNGGASDPFELTSATFEMAVNVFAMLLVAFTFLTIVKNGWQKYHQLGEAGSKVTWRDLASHMVAGLIVVTVGIFMGVYALNIF